MEVKEKHLRLVIKETFSEEDAETFWRVVLGFPCTNSKPVTWKLHYVLYRMLRKRHLFCYDYIRRHGADFHGIGKAWVSKRQNSPLWIIMDNSEIYSFIF